MPKMKTKKSVAKRFKLTGKGKIKRAKASRRHLLSHKSSKRKRRLGASGIVDPSDHKRIKSVLPYA